MTKTYLAIGKPQPSFALLAGGILFLLCGIAFPPLLLVGAAMLWLLERRLRGIARYTQHERAAKVDRDRQKLRDKGVRYFS
jgi:fatty acid desaturase